MTHLAMALFAEGPTDHQFIRIVTQRTAEYILNQNSRKIVDVLDPHIVERTSGEQAEKILDAAHSVYGFNLLLLHADADARNRDAAWADRIEPGLHRVLQASSDGEQVCDKLVPVIPVQMTEAWMLADPLVLAETIGYKDPPTRLGLPRRPRQVESFADPKAKLKEAVGIAQNDRPRRRRRDWNIKDLYQQLAGTVELDRLAQVPSYQQFQEELTQALHELHFF